MPATLQTSAPARRFLYGFTFLNVGAFFCCGLTKLSFIHCRKFTFLSSLKFIVSIIMVMHEFIHCRMSSVEPNHHCFYTSCNIRLSRQRMTLGDFNARKLSSVSKSSELTLIRIQYEGPIGEGSHSRLSIITRNTIIRAQSRS